MKALNKNGRETGMKTKIMWTIMVAAVLGIVRLPEAAGVNSNAIISDDIEYYIQTDKSVYDLGENVEMLYKVTNLGTEDVTFYFFRSPIWNFWAEKEGERIWAAIDLWSGVNTRLTFTPGEFRIFPIPNPPFIWDMRNDENNLVGLGNYDIIGGLYGGGEDDYTKVAVPIEIVPEPATILLLAIGVFGLRAKLLRRPKQ